MFRIVRTALLYSCPSFPPVDVDGRDDRRHPFKSLIIGGDGPYVPFPSHSFLSWLGPHVQILLLDCRYAIARSHLSSADTRWSRRAERRKDQVCSPQEYKAVFARMHALPRTVEHLVIQTGECGLNPARASDLIELITQESPLRTLAWSSSRRRWTRSSTRWSRSVRRARWDCPDS